MKINYLEILKQAVKITWKNKYLWWFGFFVALGEGSSFNFYTNLGSSDDFSDLEAQKILNFISQNTRWIIIGFIILFIILVVFLILKIIGRGALISCINSLFQNKPSNFKLGWTTGKKYFWKIFSVAFALRLFILAVIIVLSIPIMLLFSNGNYIIAVIMSILAFLILTPIIVLTVYSRIYGYLYVVLGQLSFWPALENAYNLFRKNILSSLIMGFLLLAINVALIIAVFMAIIPVAVIFLGIGFVLYFMAGKIGIVITVIMGIIFLLVTLLFIRSVYEIFTQAVWISFFHEIAKPKVEETIAELEKETNNVPKAMPVIELTRK